MKKFRWFIGNSIIPVSLIIGKIYHIEGLVNIALFLIVLSFITSMMFLNTSIVKEVSNKGFSVSKETDFIADFLVLFIIIYFGYIISGILWIIHSIIIVGARNEFEQKQK